MEAMKLKSVRVRPPRRPEVIAFKLKIHAPVAELHELEIVKQWSWSLHTRK
jgi:hypothetical protein